MNLSHWLILGPSFYFLHFVFFFWQGDTSGRKLYFSFSQKCLWRQTPKVGKKRWVLGYSKTCTQSVIVSYSKKSVSNNAPLSATYSSRWSNYVIKHKFSLGTNNACARKVKPSFLHVFGLNQKQLNCLEMFLLVYMSHWHSMKIFFPRK